MLYSHVKLFESKRYPINSVGVKLNEKLSTNVRLEADLFGFKTEKSSFYPCQIDHVGSELSYKMFKRRNRIFLISALNLVRYFVVNLIRFFFFY